MSSRPRIVIGITALSLVTAIAACGDRRTPGAVAPSPAPQAFTPQSGQLYAGLIPTGADRVNPYSGDEKAIAEGARLYDWFNCSGCHAGGGGGMGPPLMDDQWIYGNRPGNLFDVIVEGRPNGMPSFGGRIPEREIWQIIAFIESMGGMQERADPDPQRPARSDPERDPHK
jgi:cytochrome c oxidase cbb3-type subunit III